jgi:hypothetical protein
MKKIITAILIISISLFLIEKGSAISIFNNNNETISINKDWELVNVNENLVLPKEDKNDWSYPWYMIKHKDGHFENTFGDEIKHEDTMKLYHPSHCYSFIEKDTTSRLKYAKAKKAGKTVQISLFDRSASNYESLDLEIKNFKEFNLKYNISYVYPYDSIVFTFLKKELEIKKSNYQKGENLVGYVNCILEEKIYTNKNNKKEIHSKIKDLNGVFEVIIE